MRQRCAKVMLRAKSASMLGRSQLRSVQIMEVMGERSAECWGLELGYAETGEMKESKVDEESRRCNHHYSQR